MVLFSVYTVGDLKVRCITDGNKNDLKEGTFSLRPLSKSRNEKGSQIQPIPIASLEQYREGETRLSKQTF